MFQLSLFSLLLSVFLSWFLLFFLIPYLRSYFLDIPNNRSSHSSPTPRGGGLVFVFVSAVTFILSLLISPDIAFTSPFIYGPLLALPLALAGFIDDFRDLASSSRFLVQCATALVLIFISPLPNLVLFSPFFVFAITGLINFTNFMDGADGLLAGCMVLAFITLSITLDVPWTVWSLIGSLLGFLLWNWTPAKVFMGDVGSTFLGAVFLLFSLQADSWVQAIGLVFVLTPIFADAFICVVRRFICGHSIFQAHRLHLYQRIHQAGYSHSFISFLYILGTLITSIAFLFGGLPAVLILAFVEILVGVWLDRHLAVPFSLACTR